VDLLGGRHLAHGRADVHHLLRARVPGKKKKKKKKKQKKTHKERRHRGNNT